MSGSLPGIANTQRVDGDGKPLIGGKLYLYNAGTITPAAAFKDFNLTTGQEQPFPLVLDAYGQIPGFYLADGFYRARLTNASGSVVLFDLPQVPAVGNPDGGGGTPPTVDPTTIFNTGDFDWQPRSGSRSGWVRGNGRTIGSASSGASERANNDCQALFEFNWNTYSDTRCPVVGGRGASATADWAANKQITLIDARFIIPVGLDDMGNTAAGRAANVPVVSGDATTAASVLGETLNTLAATQIPTHKHNNTLSDPTHRHNQPKTMIATADGAGGGSLIPVYTPGSTLTDAASTGITITNADSTGGGGAHNNTPLVMPGTFYQKL